MELHRFFRYAIEKMCKEKKSLNHFITLFIGNIHKHVKYNMYISMLENIKIRNGLKKGVI